MNRKEFLKLSVPLLASVPLITSAMNLQSFSKMSKDFPSTPPMPVLFLGHGSPMNAIEENEFVQGFRKIAATLPKPAAILCVSAHWETKGTYLTAMEKPRTIHDFGGFPKALYEIQYPAPGSPDLALQTKSLLTKTEAGLDLQWGLDHGSWSVIKHLYPNADVPIIQMSLDYTRQADYHYELASQLSALRKKGILIIGSGNMVHNLGMVAWNRLNESYAYDWAIEASDTMKKAILDRNHQPLIQYQSQGKAYELAIPTPEHFYPLLYVLALQSDKDRVSLFNDRPVAGSLTMTSVIIRQS